MGRHRVNPESLTTGHVARVLGVCDRTAAKIIDTLLPHRRAGRLSRRRVRAADLRRLLEETGVGAETLDELLR